MSPAIVPKIAVETNDPRKSLWAGLQLATRSDRLLSSFSSRLPGYLPAMLGKLLFTLVIVCLGLVWAVRQRGRLEAGKKSSGTDAATGSLRSAAYLFLALMISVAAVLYYFRWQEDHEMLTITLHRDGNTPPVQYQVYRYQLGDGSFTTRDGVRIIVSASERMEVSATE